MTDRSDLVTGALSGPDWWRRPVLLIVLIWAGWALAMLAYQETVLARVAPERPDQVLSWTAGETGVRRAGGRPFLGEDVLARRAVQLRLLGRLT